MRSSGSHRLRGVQKRPCPSRIAIGSPNTRGITTASTTEPVTTARRPGESSVRRPTRRQVLLQRTRCGAHVRPPPAAAGHSLLYGHRTEVVLARARDGEHGDRADRHRGPPRSTSPEPGPGLRSGVGLRCVRRGSGPRMTPRRRQSLRTRQSRVDFDRFAKRRAQPPCSQRVEHRRPGAVERNLGAAFVHRHPDVPPTPVLVPARHRPCLRIPLPSQPREGSIP